MHLLNKANIHIHFGNICVSFHLTVIYFLWIVLLYNHQKSWVIKHTQNKWFIEHRSCFCDLSILFWTLKEENISSLNGLAIFSTYRANSGTHTTVAHIYTYYMYIYIYIYIYEQMWMCNVLYLKGTLSKRNYISIQKMYDEKVLDWVMQRFLSILPLFCFQLPKTW